MSEPQSQQINEIEKILANWNLPSDTYDKYKDKVDILRSRNYICLEQHSETLRRFFISTAGDIKVLLAAFALRLAELRLDQLDKSKGLETLEVYAPLANRLGMGRLKTEFEKLSFPVVYPEEFKETKRILKINEKFANRRLEKIHHSLRKYFVKENIPIKLVDYRLKNTYSLWLKLNRPEIGKDISKIHDLMALRIVTDSVENCYKIMGLIHSKWKPLSGKIKDYIANPKPNGYRSLHTTIYTGDGGTAEIQIRTSEMHQEAEYGITSHIAYDESGKPKHGGIWPTKLAWVRELIELARKGKQESFAEAIKLDFFKYRIFVFTPKGEIIELPDGATPIDFAYRIHSDIGNHAHAAVINGRYKPLDTPLHGGETILIEVDKKARPSAKWLNMANSSETKRKIRSTLSHSFKR